MGNPSGDLIQEARFVREDLEGSVLSAPIRRTVRHTGRRTGSEAIAAHQSSSRSLASTV